MQHLPDALGKLSAKTPDTYTYSRKRQANTPASPYYRKTSWENLKNKEPPRIVSDDNAKMIIHCFEYLEHLQDLKTQSLLPVQDYTTTTQDCLRAPQAKRGLYHPLQVLS